MKIGLYSHGGSGNHGCEAIAKTTIKLLGGNEYTVFSERPEDDLLYGLDKVARIIPAKNDMPGGLRRLVYTLMMSLLREDNLYWSHRYRDFARKAEGLDLALAIGGDNYCYRGFMERFSILNRALVGRGIPIVLWGCSIDRERISSEMIEDLRLYSLIVARESITYSSLKDAGVENVAFMPDPAFLLKEADTPLPEGFMSGNMVGLNISPLIIRSEVAEGSVLLNCRRLIDFILENTDMGVALIPHVSWEGNDDRMPLSQLFEEYGASRRVIMVQDMEASALKGIIRRCRFMVAPRTHASIAAYSSKIPTLVLGYSVKSSGIATDLFGTASHYVLPVHEMGEGSELRDAFRWLVESEDDIKACYDARLKDYIGMVNSSVLYGRI